MRIAWLSRVKPGAVLAQSILDERGRVLLAAGMELSQSLIYRLIAKGIRSAYIEDDLCRDVEPDSVVSESTRRELIRVAYNSLTRIIGSAKSPRGLQRRGLGREVRHVVDELLAEIGAHRGMTVPLSAIYSSDATLYHHSVNVAILSVAIGAELGMGAKELSDLGVGALLHDVGKLKIPPEILHKPTRLSAREFDAMKAHTTEGFLILRTLSDVPSVAALIAYEHHERLNGTGYPRGIRQEQHSLSRIVAVGDVYEALTANRVYRKGYLPHQALEFVLGGAAAGFDNQVVEAFMRCVAIYPKGSSVRLRTGEVGIVLGASTGQPQRPLLRIIVDSAGNRLSTPYEVDMRLDLRAEIVECES